MGWNDLHNCMTAHSHHGLDHLFNTFGNSSTYIFEHLVEIWISALIILFAYASIDRNSDASITMSNAINAVRDDLKAASCEIRTSVKNVCVTLSQSIAIVKIMEVLLIGSFFVILPDAFHFLLKSYAKLAKI